MSFPIEAINVRWILESSLSLPLHFPHSFSSSHAYLSLFLCLISLFSLFFTLSPVHCAFTRTFSLCISASHSLFLPLSPAPPCLALASFATLLFMFHFLHFTQLHLSLLFRFLALVSIFLYQINFAILRCSLFLQYH